MKIKTSKLEQFLRISQMEEVESCLLEFTEEGLRMNVANPAATNMCRSILKKEEFEEYSPIGNVGMDDLSRFIKVIKKLGEELNFSVEGNMLVAKSDKKQLNFELVDEKFIDKDMIEKIKGMNFTDFTTSFNVSVGKLVEFFDDLSINSDCLINIKTVENGVQFYNTGKYKFTHNIDSENTNEGVKLVFGEPFLKTFSGVRKEIKQLKDNVLEFNVKENYPTKTVFSFDNTEYEFYIIPREEE